MYSILCSIVHIYSVYTVCIIIQKTNEWVSESYCVQVDTMLVSNERQGRDGISLNLFFSCFSERPCLLWMFCCTVFLVWLYCLWYRLSVFPTRIIQVSPASGSHLHRCLPHLWYIALKLPFRCITYYSVVCAFVCLCPPVTRSTDIIIFVIIVPVLLYDCGL